MFYNTQQKRIKHDSDCVRCEAYDKATKTCNGYGAICFEYDQITDTMLDPITGIPFKPSEEQPNGNSEIQ